MEKPQVHHLLVSQHLNQILPQNERKLHMLWVGVATLIGSAGEGTVGKPFILYSIYSATGTVNLTALITTQFPGGQTSLTSFFN